MRNQRMTRIVRVAVVACAALALLGLAPAASARGIQTGFLDPGAIARGDGFTIQPDVAMGATAGAGGGIVRLYLNWRRVVPGQVTEPANPTLPSTYTWNAGHLNDSVTAAVNKGLKVMLTIRSAPDYAQRGTPDSRGTHDPSPAMLARFTQAATAQFNDKVHLWGVWNEPNLRSFLSPQRRNGKLVSPTLYKGLLKAAAPVIYNSDPRNKIVAGETAPFGNADTSPLAFLRKLLCMKGRSSPTPTSCNPKLRADYWAVHPYTSGNVWHHAFHPDDVSFGDLPQWKKLIARAVKAGHLRAKGGGKNVGYWITEFSWDTKPPDPKAVPTTLHARWTSEAIYRAWQLGFQTLLWGQLRDYPIGSDPTYGQYQSGLYYYNGGGVKNVSHPKPSLNAFRFPFVAYARHGHITVWGRTRDSTGGTVRIERKTSSGWHLVTKASANSQGIFAKRFASSRTNGYLRAKDGTEASVKFSLKRPKDRFVNPFGCGGRTPCS
jgi:hypothetical protein